MSGTPSDPASLRVAHANRFHATLQALVGDPQTHAEVIAVVAFYKALHLVDAQFLASKGYAPSTHRDRAEMLARDRRRVDLFRPYNALLEAAYVARYLTVGTSGAGVPSFFDYMPADEVVPRVVEQRLRAFEGAVVRLLPGPLRKAVTRV